MLKIAILSAWHVHANQYATEFSNMSDTKITVVWDEEPERGKAFAEKYNADFEPDYHKLLERDDVDAVCVTSPTSMHTELLIASANAKKHIFTEKVLALTNEDAVAIRDAVVQNDIKFCISFPHRTNPNNLFAKQAIESGLIGEPTLVRVRNCHNGSTRGWLPPHFYDETLCGGGAMIDLGAHPMYLIRWLMGKPESVTSVFTSFTDKPVEDNAVSLFKYPNGAIAISETGFVSEQSPFALEVYGTLGTVFSGGWDGGVKLFTSKTGLEYNGWIKPSQLPKPLAAPTLQFAQALKGEGEITFGIEEGVQLTELMVAAYQSHREGKLVTF